MKMDQIIEFPIEDLKPYAQNPRINEKAVEPVAESIRRFGFTNPILIDKYKEIVAGHTRLQAAKIAGMQKVPCIMKDHWTPEEVRAYRLVDNKTAEFAEWDTDLLRLELSALEESHFNMTLYEFDSFFEIEEKECVEDDYDVVLPIEPRTKRGQVWELGSHRLMCGDACDSNDVRRLIDGATIEMVFTDPPYNIDYQGIKDKRQVENDSMGEAEFLDFLKASILPAKTVYVCCSWQYAHLFKRAMTELKIAPKAMIVWDKVNPAQNLDRYYKQHELIFYHGAFGGQRTLRGDVWQIKRERNIEHPTMKPLALIGLALSDNPKARRIYDPFGGSGSTLIACEQLGRRECFMMEIDPCYCDVIIDRWTAYTDQEARLVSE